MFSKSFAPFVALSVLLVSEPVLGRYKWMERDNRPVYLYPRRFDQEHPQALTDLSSACPGQVCGNLAGQAVSTLLAAADECAQQDMADQIIDAAAQFDAATQQNMINIAVQFRQAEKNTPPDFSVQPNINRNSVFCQKAPKNSQLNGLVQAQDPANDPNVFFDPATSSSVTLGSQPNTFPFGTSGSASSNSTAVSSSVVADVTSAANLAVETESLPPCGSVPTLTISDTSVPSNTDAITLSVSGTAAAVTASSTASSGSIGDFGSCSVPQIEFGVGFDNRKETSFQPVDQTSYNHGSAQNIDIITQFMCDQLVNTCGADATAKATCAKAQAAADTGTAKNGIQADLFNAVFGITTDFAADAVVDDQGNTISSGLSTTPTAAVSSDAASATVEAITTAATEAATEVASSTSAATTAAATAASNSAIGDFGSCSVPQIEFGTGFDGRKETSFEPVDKTSYNHGSAQNIDIITQFMCDQLVNSCGADATAKATCAKAQAAADTGTAKEGIQADLFNAVFGITTDFAAVAEVDDQGNVVAGTGSASASANAGVVAIATTAAASIKSATSTTAAPAAASTTAAAAASGANLQTFTGALGGVTAPTVTAIGNGQFQVEGNSAFNSLSSALERSCDVQNNQCANAANASGNQNGLTVAACNAQQAQCNA
ncbi:hypothetical protein SCHPADRAFT_937092 [Schizopora paradoxa]|uniref:Uncharacterized protein n=1 Tax=Schizopora paradoxa TaxID=27342 RepID=A0A0H2S6T1_9AGAM|nr:hypothetical protein SCHPADRAFT_937092 [Schizopora paradoxa]